MDLPATYETAVEIVENEIKSAAEDVFPDTVVLNIDIAEGGGEVKFYCVAKRDGRVYIVHVAFAEPVADLTPGLSRFSKVNNRAFRAMGAILTGRSDLLTIHDFPAPSMELH